MVASWFLLNGAIIHIFMDGLIGVFKVCRPFQRHYAKLDKRYGEGDATVDVISLLELFLYGPASLVLYYAYYTRRTWRYPLEIAVSCFQMYGAILFVFTEVWYDFAHLPADRKFEFKFDHLLYFWFGFWVANSIWFVIPSWVIYGASKHIIQVLNTAKIASETATETLSFTSPLGSRGTSTTTYSWKTTKVNGSTNGSATIKNGRRGSALSDDDISITAEAIAEKVGKGLNDRTQGLVIAKELDDAINGLLKGSVFEATEHAEKAGRALGNAMNRPISLDDNDDGDEEDAPVTKTSKRRTTNSRTRPIRR